MAMMEGSPATRNIPSDPSLRLERQFSVKEAEESHELLACIEDGDVQDLHCMLSKMPGGITSVLNTPSLLVQHNMRTPLMAAAATGDLARFTTTLQAFNAQFSNKLQRDAEMRTQLTNRDKEGMTITMLAARSSNVAVLNALLAEIDHTGALMTLHLYDHKRMTLLMHAVSTGPAPMFQELQQALIKSLGGNQDEFGRHLLRKSTDGRTILMHATASGDAMMLVMVSDACRSFIRPAALRGMLIARDSDGLNLLMHAASGSAPPSTNMPLEPMLNPGSSEKNDGSAAVSSSTDNMVISAQGAEGPGTNTMLVDSFSKSNGSDSAVEKMVEADEKEANKRSAVVVPVFKVAVRLVNELLWSDEVLRQLKAVDMWGRSVLTHALLSGYEKMFEAAYGAVRDVVLDEQVSEMMETNEGEREDTPMIEALARGDEDIRKLYALRAGQLKKDVDARSKLSSVDAKIEAFIPGKLVVMFQLLLPQIATGRQLILLYIMCALAPLIKLATGSTDPDSKHAGIAPRANVLSIFLAAPAMFFWGVGTSTIGQTALGWKSSLSATAMAAATLVIPAVDSFFNSKQASAIGDKICCHEWRFNWKASQQWRKIRKRMKSNQKAQNELPLYSTFGGRPVTTSSQGAEEEKHGASASAVVATFHEQQKSVPSATLAPPHPEKALTS